MSYLKRKENVNSRKDKYLIFSILLLLTCVFFLSINAIFSDALTISRTPPGRRWPDNSSSEEETNTDSRPDVPIKRPGAPTNPEPRPTQPIKRPDNPDETPTNPVPRPTEPIKRPETPTNPEPRPTEPIKRPEKPTDQPPVEEKQEPNAEIEIFYEDENGQKIQETKRVKGVDKTKLDLSEHLLNIESYKHIGYEPSSGYQDFDKNVRQKVVIIYQKEVEEKIAEIEIRYEDENGKKIQENRRIQGKDGQELDLSKYVKDIENYKHTSYLPKSGKTIFDSKKIQDVSIIYKKEEKIETKPPQNNTNNVNNNSNNNKITPTPNRLNKNVKIMSGYPDGTMRPNNPVTREEVAAIMYKLLKDEFKGSINVSNFYSSDLSEKNWSYEPVSKIVSLQVMQTTSDGRFLPKHNATRKEVAYAIAYLTEMTSPKFNVEFSDTSDNLIASVVSNGYMSGYPDGSFKPNESITRAELVVVINRVLNRDINNIQKTVYFKDIKESAWYYKYIQAAVQEY